jgi:hypothetical protein
VYSKKREGAVSNATIPGRQLMVIRSVLAVAAAVLLIVGWYRWAT